jgi:hypothetical protein
MMGFYETCQRKLMLTVEQASANDEAVGKLGESIAFGNLQRQPTAFLITGWCIKMTAKLLVARPRTRL